jgi:hypothetical protein
MEQRHLQLPIAARQIWTSRALSKKQPERQPGEAALQLQQRRPAKPRPGLSAPFAPRAEPRRGAALRKAELAVEYSVLREGRSRALPGASRPAEWQRAWAQRLAEQRHRSAPPALLPRLSAV